MTPLTASYSLPPSAANSFCGNITAFITYTCVSPAIQIIAFFLLRDNRFREASADLEFDHDEGSGGGIDVLAALGVGGGKAPVLAHSYKVLKSLVTTPGQCPLKSRQIESQFLAWSGWWSFADRAVAKGTWRRGGGPSWVKPHGSRSKTAAPEFRCAKAGKSDCASATSQWASHPAQEYMGHETMHVNHSGPRALRARLDASPGRACYNLEAQCIKTRRCPAQAECNSASTRNVDVQVASTAADSFLPARALGYIYDSEETVRETARDVHVQVLTRGEYRFKDNCEYLLKWLLSIRYYFLQYV